MTDNKQFELPFTLESIAPPPPAGTAKISIPLPAYEESCRVRALTGWPISKMVARLLHRVEQNVLPRLTEAEKRQYFAKELGPVDYKRILARGEPSATDICHSEG